MTALFKPCTDQIDRAGNLLFLLRNSVGNLCILPVNHVHHIQRGAPIQISGFFIDVFRRQTRKIVVHSVQLLFHKITASASFCQFHFT